MFRSWFDGLLWLMFLDCGGYTHNETRAALHTIARSQYLGKWHRTWIPDPKFHSPRRSLSQNRPPPSCLLLPSTFLHISPHQTTPPYIKATTQARPKYHDIPSCVSVSPSPCLRRDASTPQHSTVTATQIPSASVSPSCLCPS
jgi:hypothetical protein